LRASGPNMFVIVGDVVCGAGGAICFFTVDGDVEVAGVVDRSLFLCDARYRYALCSGRRRCAGCS